MKSTLLNQRPAGSNAQVMPPQKLFGDAKPVSPGSGDGR